MASLKTIIDIFEAVATADTAILEFKYGKVWDMNGKPSAQYPKILVESQPNWTTTGNRLNFGSKSIKKSYTIKVFAYDLYNTPERSAKNLWTKQSELEDKFENYLAEVWVRLSAINGIGIESTRNGFHGYFEQHNSKLIQVYEEIKVTIPVACTTGTFI